MSEFILLMIPFRIVFAMGGGPNTKQKYVSSNPSAHYKGKGNPD